MSNICTFSKARTPKMGWMVHSEWCWWMTLVDPFYATQPKLNPLVPVIAAQKGISIGCNTTATTCNGPNGGTHER